MEVSIRDVDEDTWAEFKARAAASKMKISDYLEKLLKEAKDNNWAEIIYGEKSLDDETAKDIMERSKEIRKNFKMREFD